MHYAFQIHPRIDASISEPASFFAAAARAKTFLRFTLGGVRLGKVERSQRWYRFEAFGISGSESLVAKSSTEKTLAKNSTYLEIEFLQLKTSSLDADSFSSIEFV